MLIAHRGFAGEKPENSLEAIRFSNDRADMVELDVRETADGEFILSHDEDFSDLVISETDLEMLQETLQDSSPVLLEEALSVAKIPVLLELKGSIDVQSFIERVAQLEDSVPEILLQSFHPQHIQEISEVWGGRYGLLVPTWDLFDVHGVPPDSLVADRDIFMVSLLYNCSFIGLYMDKCRPSVVEACDGLGLDVYVWTIRDAEAWSKFSDRSVSGLISDYSTFE
jgi:glycerophosphoryl diester phosphodiesterase